MIKTIIFDAGGVLLISEGYVKYLKRKLNLDKQQIRKLKKVYESAERGEIGSRVLHRMLSAMLDIHHSHLLWPDETRRSTKVDKRVRRLIIKLSKEYRVALLTNMVKDRYIWMVKNSLIERKLFVRVFVSSYLRMSKPDPKIFKFVLKALDASPGETLFIDDKLENVESARKLGITSLQYINYGQLEADLKRLKIKV